MDIVWRDLTVNFSHLDRHDLVESWHWLVGDDKLPVLVSSMGDMFLEDDHGQVYFLDVGAAKIKQVSPSIDEFKAMLMDEAFVEKSFHPQAVNALHSGGIKLPSGQVFGYGKPQASGGDLSSENRIPCDMAEHFKLTGTAQATAHS